MRNKVDIGGYLHQRGCGWQIPAKCGEQISLKAFTTAKFMSETGVCFYFVIAVFASAQTPLRAY